MTTQTTEEIAQAAQTRAHLLTANALMIEASRAQAAEEALVAATMFDAAAASFDAAFQTTADAGARNAFSHQRDQAAGYSTRLREVAAKETTA